MTLERPPLEDALGIPGARAVSLLDPDGPAMLWWAGAGPPDERAAAALASLAAAAIGLVAVSEPGDELGDVLLTSSDAFHVVRVVPDGSYRVAHLALRRSGANLAMARHEFKTLIDRHCHRTAAASSDLAPTVSELAAADTPDTNTEWPDTDSPGADSPSEEADPAAPLPRRRRGEPPAAVNGSGEVPDWFSMLGQLYRTDDGVLDRILVTLRHL